MIKNIKKKIKNLPEQIFKLFVLPLFLQTVVVHIMIGNYLSSHVVGRKLLLQESLSIAFVFVICQIVQLQTFSIKRKTIQLGEIKILKSEIVK